MLASAANSVARKLCWLDSWLLERGIIEIKRVAVINTLPTPPPLLIPCFVDFVVKKNAVD